MSQKSIILVLGVVVAILIGATIYVAATRNERQQATPTPKKTQQSAMTQPTDETTSWQTYKNDQYGFAINYPKNWQLESTLSNGNFSIKSPGEISPTLEISFTNEKYAKVLEKEQNKFSEWQKVNIETPSGEILDVQFAGNAAKEFLYYSSFGSISQTIILEKDNNVVIIHSYKNSILDPILSTFKFTK